MEQNALEIGMVVHKVVAPPHKSTLEKLRTRLRETFFPDDPSRQFKGQPLKQKWILGAQFIFPIVHWGPNYSLKFFKSDLIAGLTIASLAIPQGISYAKLASLPPIVGLYSSFVPPLVYAVLGSSRDLAVGPVSIASLILGSMLAQEVSPVKEPALYLQLAFTTTFFAGLFQTSLGLLRLGFFIDFLSKATLIGFMAGAAIIVSLQQLKSLLGITHFTKQMGLVPVLSSVFHHTKEWSWQTILMGICFLVFLLVARHIVSGSLLIYYLKCTGGEKDGGSLIAITSNVGCFVLITFILPLHATHVSYSYVSMLFILAASKSLRRPKLFWVSAGAPLVSVIISTLLVFAFKAQHHGIDVIGELQQGLNPPSWSMLQFHGSHLGLALKTGLVTGIISLTEGVAVGRTFASLKNYKVDGNKEMMAIGLMNMIGSSTSCYVTTGAFSRSAVNHNAGAKTAVSNLVMSITVMVTLLFLMPLFQYTPNVVLGAIIVSAVVGLIDLPAASQIWKIDKFDFLVLLCAFFGVIFISVQDGLAIAVGISIFKILLQVTRPKTVMLGNIPRTNIYRDLHHYTEATKIPGFLILSIEAPINFANSMYLNERILRWVEDHEADEELRKYSSLQFVVLDMSAVSDIDTSGVSLLRELTTAIQKKHAELVLVNPLAVVIEKLHKSEENGILAKPDGLYLSVGEAVASLSSSIKVQPPNNV